MSPGLKLLLSVFGTIYVFKAIALVSRRRPCSGSGLGLFLLVWPGVIPDHFEKRGPGRVIEPASFLAAWARTVLGTASIFLLAVYAPDIPDDVLGLVGIAALLVTIHLGIGSLLPWLLRWAGFPAPLLFDRPWAAGSLGEFWSRRWNLAFVEMNRRLFLRPSYRFFGESGSRFALFALSGLLHEVGLSVPVGAGWGLPLGYFLLQGVLVTVEQRFRVTSRLWTWFCLIAPAPWLFHEPFRRTLIVPFFHWLHGLIARNGWEWYLSNAIYAAAIAQVMVLAASAQVPARLGWKSDLAKLTRFNQKVFWVYSFYIVFCIVSFGALTWLLHDEFLTGELAARYLAGFIAVFWTVRVLIDLFWYDHRDWPQGNILVAGHALLTSLFCTLAGVYWCVVFAPAR